MSQEQKSFIFKMLLESRIFFLKNVFGQDHFSGEQDLITT